MRDHRELGMLRLRDEHPIKRVVVMARQPPCREGMGHRNREGLKLARRQGCFEVVRGFKHVRLMLISQAVAALTKTSVSAARMAVRATGVRLNHLPATTAAHAYPTARSQGLSAESGREGLWQVIEIRGDPDPAAPYPGVRGSTAS